MRPPAAAAANTVNDSLETVVKANPLLQRAWLREWRLSPPYMA